MDYKDSLQEGTYSSRFQLMQNELFPNPRYANQFAYCSVAILLALCWWMVMYYDGPKKLPIFRMNADMQMWGCLVTGLLVITYGYIRRYKTGLLQRFPITPAYVILLTLLFLQAGAFNMVVGGINKGIMFIHRHDTYHYLLGVKYFPDLKYNKLYACTVAADAESEKPQLNDTDKVRNLDNYRTYPIRRYLRAWKRECPRLLGERWDEFKQDIETYKKMGDLKNFIRDMGYNGSPTHAFYMGKIANNVAITPENIRKLTLLDISLICGMTALLIWVGGWHIGLLSGIYLHSFIGDRFHIIGNSFGRYVWLFLLILGICLLIKKRHRIAGFFMSMSMMTTLFPGLFFAGAGLAGLRDWIQSKRFPVTVWRLGIAAIATVILAVLLGTIEGDGPKNFVHFADNLSVHSQPLTSKRVNLRYLLMIESETPDDGIGILGNREEIYDMMRPAFILFATIALAVCAHACWRNKIATEDCAIFMGLALMLTITPIVCYYFTASMLLLLLYRRFQYHFGGMLFMGALFLGMAYLVWHGMHLDPQLKEVQRKHQMYNINLTSYMMLALGSVIAMWNIITPKEPEQPQVHL